MDMESRNHTGWRQSGVVSRFNIDRKSTRLNSSHDQISYAVFCLKKKKNEYRMRALLKQSRQSRLRKQSKIRTSLGLIQKTLSLCVFTSRHDARCNACPVTPRESC